MKKNIFILLLLLFPIFIGCKSDIAEVENETKTTLTENDSDSQSVMPGVIRVKLTVDVADSFARSADANENTAISNEAIDKYVAQIGAKRMTRVFPYAGKFEARTRAAGLHRWYDIEFEEGKSSFRATAKSFPGVEVVEEIYLPKQQPSRFVPYTMTDTRAVFDKFNDPFLKSQWHYDNTGVFPKFIPTADINLRKAWEIETGKPNVIVAIVDGGIDVNHQDLVDNLWRNEKEINGVDGEDDDHNGYVDDKFGYNFVSKQGPIKPHAHGTHVAGTVAARNNNGLGVAGVAGGNGSKESGVKVMSCQFVEHGPNGKDLSGDAAAAIKYGADNGAVISQNSWGFPYPGPAELPLSIKEAIDYFIERAGCDEHGNQRPDSPMKGGVVIFAVGNDNRDIVAFPAAYNRVISVASMGPAFKRAYYSNSGSWVNMTAPGGDQSYGTQGMILSTYPNNKYGYMEGSSMACPHVSGIAALVVSKYGKPGFTNEDLKKRLLNAMSIEDINEHNPEFVGKLGAGYIDAVKALSANMEKAPGAVATVNVEPDFNSLKLTWKSVQDEDDITADAYHLYYSTKGEINAGNYAQATHVKVTSRKDKADETVAFVLKSLAEDTQVYMAVVAEDRWGLKSAPTFFNGKTKKNNPPVLKWVGEAKIVLSGTQTSQGKLFVDEPDGQKWEYTLSGTTTGITHYRVGNEIVFKFRANAAPGDHTLKIDVTDSMGATSSLSVPFKVYKNTQPALINDFGKIYVPINKKEFLLDLSEFIADADGDPITYNVQSLNTSIATASVLHHLLTIVPKQLGQLSIEVTATDINGSSIKSVLEVNVVNEGLVHNVYPIPTKDVLNIVLDKDVFTAKVSILTATGNLASSQYINATDFKNRVAKIDVSKLSARSYILEVAANGKIYKTPFVKY